MRLDVAKQPVEPVQITQVELRKGERGTNLFEVRERPRRILADGGDDLVAVGDERLAQIRAVLPGGAENHSPACH